MRQNFSADAPKLFRGCEGCAKGRAAITCKSATIRAGFRRATRPARPTAFNPTAFHPTAFHPTAFNPTAFNPTAFNPIAFNEEPA